LRQARRRDPADLHGDVGPQRQRPQRDRIDEAEHAARLHAGHAARHRLLEFDRRRLDPQVAMRGEDIEGAAPHLARGGRLLRQTIAQALGQKIAVGIVHRQKGLVSQVSGCRKAAVRLYRK
jgi:hypothetical protein